MNRLQTILSQTESAINSQQASDQDPLTYSSPSQQANIQSNYSDQSSQFKLSDIVSEQPLSILKITQQHSAFDSDQPQSILRSSEFDLTPYQQDTVFDTIDQYLDNFNNLSQLFAFAFGPLNKIDHNPISTIHNPISTIEEILKEDSQYIDNDDLLKAMFSRPDIMSTSLIQNIAGFTTPIFIVNRYTNSTKLLMFMYLHSHQKLFNTPLYDESLYNCIYKQLYFNEDYSVSNDVDIDENETLFLEEQKKKTRYYLGNYILFHNSQYATRLKTIFFNIDIDTILTHKQIHDDQFLVECNLSAKDPKLVNIDIQYINNKFKVNMTQTHNGIQYQTSDNQVWHL